MSANCQEHRAELIALSKGELDALRTARLQAHLERCPSCRGGYRDLSRALALAGSWSPEIAPEELARLDLRLAELHAPAPRRGPGLVLSVALAAAGAAFLLLRPAPLPEPRPAATAAAPVRAPDPHPGLAAPETIGRQALNAHVRLISGPGYAGRAESRGPKHTWLRIERGFALLSFQGGEGRRLEVEAARLRIEATGTRFFVDVTHAPLTRIGVLSGEVKVEGPQGADTIDAGSTREYGQEGAATAAAPPALAESLKDDPFLDLVTEARTRTAKKAPPAAPPPVLSPDALRRMAEAEALARSGRVGEALALYTELAAAGPPGIRRVARFEHARLEGDALELERLATEDQDEVSVQAALLLCERARAGDRCAGVRCLERWQSEPKPRPALLKEAQRLHARWTAAGGCPPPVAQ